MADLLEGKANVVLAKMSVPISLGMLSTFLFQVIDTYFVGQLGANPLAALSFASTLYFMAVGLFIGLSVGVSILIGEASGKKDQRLLANTSLLAICLSFALSILLSLAVVYTWPYLFGLLGAEGEVLILTGQYIVPLFWGIPLLTGGIMIGGILRATGNISKPEIIMGIAGLINLVFDYLLIYGKYGFPELGIQGAAYATVLSWIFVILGMLFLLWKDKLLTSVNQLRKGAKGISRNIFRMGGPSILTQIVGPFSLVFLTFLLAQQSELAVAAFGVAGRIETLLMIGILGVSTALTPFIAQNAGAKQTDRINQAIAFGGKASTYLGLLLTILLFLLIKPIAGLFSEDPTVIATTSNYFYIVSLSYVLYGLYLITTSIFNGLQLPLNSLKISLIKTFLLTIPLCFAGSFWGVNGIFIGLALSNVLAGLYASRQMRKEFIRSNSSLTKVNIWQEYRKDFQTLISFLRRKG